MTMKDDDFDLGLNLVFDAPPPSTTSSGGGGGASNKKRKTKYDKRRERGRLAKLAKGREGGVLHKRADDGDDVAAMTTNSSLIVTNTRYDPSNNDQPPPPLTPNDDSTKTAAASSLAGIAVALLSASMSSKSETTLLSKEALPAMTPRQTTLVISKRNTNTTNTTSDSSSSALSELMRGVSYNSSAASTVSSPPANNKAKEEGHTTVHPMPTPTALSSLTLPSTRRQHHMSQTDYTNEQRSAYLSEFHARPRDMDRNVHACRVIKSSCISDHIFEHHQNDNECSSSSMIDDDISNDPRDDNNNNIEKKINIDMSKLKETKEAHQQGSTTSNNCPFTKLGVLHPRLVYAITSSHGPFKLVRPTIIQSRCIMSLLTSPPITNNPTSSSSLLPAAGTATTKRKTKKTTVVTTLMTKSNLFVQSETGSGKTLAYLLPIVQHLASSSSSSSSSSDHTTTTNSSSSNNSRYDNGTKCIILCPTRELCTQTYDTIHKLCQFAGYSSYIVPGCLSGGEKRKSEKSRLRKGITILVATPGRLLDHLTKTESLILSLKKKKTMKNGGGESGGGSGGGLEWLVLDEADRLLDGGGLGGQVEQIIQRLRACCSDGGKNDNVIMWRNVLVSATITKELEEMANKVLGVHDDSWMWARGHTTATTPTDGQGGGIMSATTSIMTSNQCFSDNNGNLSSSTQHATASDGANNNSHELDNAAPRQLAQLYMIVSAKLRLSSLIAFLVARAAKGERTVVFLSTCDSVDYHHALFTSMTSILENDDDEELSGKDSGIFGNACPIYKLHGDIPHNKRLSTLQSFNNTQQPQQQQQQQLQQQSAILLATDVAARGLNFSSLDWIVQYDPPCETKDYVHRAGRSARAGQAGHALLFLLPSERQYIEVLELRGLREISPLSLSSTLSSAATLCAGLTREGETKVSTTGGSNNTFASDGVKAEAFTFAIQNRLEQCVLQDDVNYKTAIEKKFKGDPKQRGRKQQRKKDALVGPLLEGARKAFSAFVRAYPAKEKSVRHIFNARALHLGHIARSLALKETPKMVSKGNNSSHGRGSGVNIIDIGGKGEKYVRDKLQSKSSKGEKRKSRLAFGDTPVEMMDTNDSVAIEDLEQDQYMSLLGHVIGAGVPRSSLSNKKSKHSGGHSGGNDAETRMMKAAMLMQSQEYM